MGAGNDYHKELQFRKLNAAKDVLNTKVVRGGQRLVVPSTELVVGDIVLLDTGAPPTPALPPAPHSLCASPVHLPQLHSPPPALLSLPPFPLGSHACRVCLAFDLSPALNTLVSTAIDT